MAKRKKSNTTAGADVKETLQRLQKEIEERRRVEAILRENMEFQQALMDAIPVPVFHKNAEGFYTGVNRAFVEFYGRSEDEIVGCTVDDLAPKELADIYRAADERLFNHPGKEHYESQVIDARQVTHNVIFHKSSFANTAGKTIGVIGVVEDITERKKAETVLRESEERYRILVEHNQDGVFIIQDGVFTYINQAFCELADLPAEQIIGRAMLDLVAPEERATVGRHYQERMHGGSVAEDYEFHALQGPQQSRILVHMKVGRLMLQGRPAAIGTLRDITAQKTAEQALRHKHQELLSAYSQLSAAQAELCRSYDELTKSQNALRAREERIRTLTENTADIIFRMNLLDGRYEYVNPASLAITGYSPEDFYREPLLIRRIIHPAWAEYFEREYENLLVGEALPIYEFQIIHADGKPRWVLQRNVLVKDADGRPIALEGLVSDITERKMVEQKLREEMKFTDTVINSLPGIFYVFNSEGYLVRWNQNHQDVLGYSADEMSKIHIKQLLAAECRDTVQNAMKAVFTEGVATLEASFLTKDGKKLPFHMLGVSMVVGEEAYVVGTGLDISDRKRAEDDLRQSQQLFSTIFSANPAAIILVTVPDGKCVDANEAYAKLVGFDREEIIGRTTLELGVWRTPEERERALDAFRRKDRIESELRRKDGQLIQTIVGGEHVEINGQPYLLSFFFDITDRKREEAERIELERRLLHAQKLESLGVMAGGIAHDFNNLLMAVLGNLDMTMLDLPSNSPARADIEQAMQATRRATDLTRQMLAYSGRGRLAVACVDLNQLIRDNASLFRTAVARTVTMNLLLANEPPYTEADPGQVQQIVMNLITNASEAIGDRYGVITLSTGAQHCSAKMLSRSRIEEKPPPGRYVFFEVADDGCGMNEETIHRLFDPFFTTKFTGRGLGMSAVSGIIRGHHGAILVDSKVGLGTTIRVLLPMCDAPAKVVAVDPASVTSRLSGRIPTVLVVDDEESVRTLCTKFIRHLGYEIICAVDGQEAVKIFDERGAEIDCVLLDLTMPRMDGVQTFQEMKLRQPDVRVILSSGYNEQDAVQRFRGEGLAGFIQKPYRLSVLQALIDRVLTGA